MSNTSSDSSYPECCSNFPYVACLFFWKHRRTDEWLVPQWPGRGILGRLGEGIPESSCPGGCRLPLKGLSNLLFWFFKNLHVFFYLCICKWKHTIECLSESILVENGIKISLPLLFTGSIDSVYQIIVCRFVSRNAWCSSSPRPYATHFPLRVIWPPVEVFGCLCSCNPMPWKFS